MGSKDGSVTTRAGHRKCRPQVRVPNSWGLSVPHLLP